MGRKRYLALAGHDTKGSHVIVLSVSLSLLRFSPPGKSWKMGLDFDIVVCHCYDELSHARAPSEIGKAGAYGVIFHR